MKTKYRVAMQRTWTTWFDLDASSQEEAEQKFRDMVKDDDSFLYEKELRHQNITSEYYELYEGLKLVKEI